MAKFNRLAKSYIAEAKACRDYEEAYELRAEIEADSDLDDEHYHQIYEILRPLLESDNL